MGSIVGSVGESIVGRRSGEIVVLVGGVLGRIRTYRCQRAPTGRHGGEVAVADGGKGDDEEVGRV